MPAAKDKEKGAFHKASERHVLVIEACMDEDDKRRVFNISNLLRLAGNELTALMRKNISQLLRTKKYRKLRKLYGTAVKNEDKVLKSNLSSQLKAMKDEYSVSWDYCWRAMIPIAKKYALSSVFARTRAEDIWRGVEKVLYGDGKMLHFQKRGDFPILRAKEIARTITVKNLDGKLVFSCGGITFSPIIKDRFHQDEVDAVLHYLENPSAVDEEAVRVFQESGDVTDTYRPCYAALKCEKIRGKLRVFIHLMIEGKAKPGKA